MRVVSDDDADGRALRTRWASRSGGTGRTGGAAGPVARGPGGTSRSGGSIAPLGAGSGTSMTGRAGGASRTGCAGRASGTIVTLRTSGASRTGCARGTLAPVAP